MSGEMHQELQYKGKNCRYFPVGKCSGRFSGVEKGAKAQRLSKKIKVKRLK